ncbi:hypothetical protein HYW83_05015 [Candidatus Peregrinibacteria bacterium]|nr:hypothetical protein [Candidatus Peregrinibacteria bacterium]
MANEKAKLFDPETTGMQGLYLDINEVEEALKGDGQKRGPLFPVDLEGRIPEVQARVVELFRAGLIGARLKLAAGTGEVAETGYIPGKISPWVSKERLAKMLADAGKLIPDASDPNFEEAVLHRSIGAIALLGELINAAYASQDARSVAELLELLTADIAPGVGLDKLPWAGQRGSQGRGDVLAKRFYEAPQGGMSLQDRIMHAKSLARYQAVLNRFGTGTEAGKQFVAFVTKYYETFKRVTPGEKFKEKSLYNKEQWLEVLLGKFVSIPAENFMMDEWMAGFEACKTTDDLVAFIGTF